MANEPGRGAGAGGVRMAGARPCPSCGASVNVNATVCPECGEQLASPTKIIRCRRCHRTASAGLMVCPHCGRDLYPAPSRLLTWGLPALVAVLLAGVLLLRMGRSGSPTEWLQRQGDRVAALAGTLSNRLQPDVSVALIPAGQDPNDPLVSQAAQAAAQQQEQPQAEPASGADVDAAAGVNAVDGVAAGTTFQANPNVAAAAPVQPPAAVVTDTGSAAPAEPATQTPAPTATAPATPTAAPTAAPTATTAATMTPTATTAPTATPSQTRAVTATVAAATAATPTIAAGATASPSVSLLGLVTPTPIIETATPTPAGPVIARTVTIGRGDTLFELAQRNDVTLESLLAANDLSEDDVYTIQPGDEIKIPAPTPEGAATATPPSGPETYTIRPGDTLAAIAIRQGVSIDDLLAVNQMTLAQARTLQPGDELVIPGSEPTLPAATPTPVAAATATATTAAPTATPTATLRATATPAPTATAVSAVRLDAPVLRSPENGTSASCGSGLTLTWQAVPSIRATDQYIVHLGFISGAAGGEQVTWVIAQSRPFNNTAWQPDNEFCALAPQEFDRAWRWYVEVVEKTADGTQPVSLPSQTWGFNWR